MDGLSVTQNMSIFSSRLLKNSLSQCRYQLGFQTFHTNCIIATDLAAKFKIILELVSKLLHAAVLSSCAFNQNLSTVSRCPFLGQLVHLDLLLSTGFDLEHADLFLYHIFTQRRMNDRKIDHLVGCFGR